MSFYEKYIVFDYEQTSPLPYNRTPTGFGLLILKHFFLSPKTQGAVKKLEQSFFTAFFGTN